MTAVCCATAGNTYAYKMWNLVDDFYRESSHVSDLYLNWWSLWLQYYRIWEWYVWTNAQSNWISLDYFANVRSSLLRWWQVYYNDNSEAVAWEYVAYPLVWFSDNWQWGINFQYFVNWDTPYMENFNVLSRAWFEVSFTDDSSCLLDTVYFNAWSLIFKCSDSNKTFQILAWGYSIWLRFLYVDAYNDSNNVWLIDWENNIAWSVTLDKQHMSEILYWDVYIDEAFLKSLFSTWYSSYTVTAWGSNIFPTCWLRSCWTQSRNSSDVWFYYSKDLVPVVPDFWGNNNDNDSTFTPPVLTWSVNNYESIEKYNSCIDRYLFVSDTSAFWYSCRSDYEDWKLTREQFINLQDYVLNINSLDIYTWDTYTENCNMFVDVAEAMYEYHSWTYNVDVNLAYRWSSNPDWIDLTYICWSKPEESSSSNGVTWWQNLLNQIWVGWTVTWSWNVVDSVFDWFISIIRNPLNEYVINPIQEEYNSWYNVMNQTACIYTNNSFAYWDYILYFWVILISLVLFGIFI